MIIVGIVLVLLALLIAVVAIALVFKLNYEYSEKTKQTIIDIFKEHSFEVDSMLVASKELTLAINNHFNKIAVVENYNPEAPELCSYREIKSHALLNIENTGICAKLNFSVDSITSTITIPTYSKEAKEFCHELMAKVLFKKLCAKYPDFKFQYFASSDWQCSYIWAYDPVKCAFAYLSTSGKISHQVINLRKEFFTIDTNYGYLELPIMGQASQLIIYEKHFLYKLFSDLYNIINAHIASAFDNKLFYDSYNEILYLSNGVNSMQSILLDRIEEVFYTDTRIQFSLPNNSKIINFLSDKNFINEFEEFVVGYNLRKIANSFDYKSDKLINVNTHTKFIVDKSRDRVVYCANLNKFYSFSYLTIAFSNLLSADVHKNASVCYVRIKTKDDDVYDVTCQKTEVAYYVKAQIDSIISGELS